MPPNSDGDTVVLINVFTVEPANQQRLVDLLTRATDGSVNRAPGFISATLRRWPAGSRCSGDAWAGQFTAPLPNYCRKFGGSHTAIACARRLETFGMCVKTPPIAP
jgi:hypothetical protein